MGKAKQLTQTFTYADYKRWPDDECWELLDGIAYAMTAPARIHQLVSFEIGFQIRSFFADKRCSIYVVPFDVRLPKQAEADEHIDTVVQPDIAVICDKNKLDNQGCRGAPDWIIEILSPSTALKDMDTKRWLYERHKIKEYWIVHPTDHWIIIYTLNANQQYGHARMFGMDKPTQVVLFPELKIDWEFIQEESE